MQVIEVEAPDESAAAFIAEGLEQLGPTTVVWGEGRFYVRVDALGDSDQAVVDALGAVERWLDACGLAETVVRVNDHVYLVPRAARPEPAPR